jgi:sec-independent protein translocase protein TatA
MAVALLFDISGGELLLILLFVLMFFGAKGIPDIARTMGRAVRQMRDASDSVQREIQRSANDVRRGVDQQVRPLRDAADAIKKDAPALEKEGPTPSAPPPGPAGSIPSEN